RRRELKIERGRARKTPDLRGVHERERPNDKELRRLKAIPGACGNPAATGEVSRSPKRQQAITLAVSCFPCGARRNKGIASSATTRGGFDETPRFKQLILPGCFSPMSRVIRPVLLCLAIAATPLAVYSQTTDKPAEESDQSTIFPHTRTGRYWISG